ncbi:MAG: DUF6502 family protein, partial [Gammaproteobacteria bacterium]|nr:DUF6502 family protein [Gammaproteobacteria bacterium]
MHELSAMNNEHIETKSLFINFLLKGFRPLVKLLISFGITYREFAEIFRWLYVDVALKEPEFALASRGTQTKARVSILTGIGRKDVARLSELPREKIVADIPRLNRAARVFGIWASDENYCDENGNPKEIPLYGKEYGSFEYLVRQYGGDV